MKGKPDEESGKDKKLESSVTEKEWVKELWGRQV